MIETLYVHRPLLNADKLIEWAKKQGFSSTLDPDDMHVTVTFSKTAFDWSGLKPQKNKIRVTGGSRDVDHLGDKGAIVLHFDSSELHQRWQEIIDEGASWDYEDYHPHISITYDGGDFDPADAEPYVGELILGPEIFAPFVDDWDKKITEIPTKGKKHGVSASESARPIKYFESITGEQTMNDSLASLLMKNIDLILEAFNVDEKGNLVEVNKRKVAQSDEIFHEYFVKRMNSTFRQINENDPILSSPENMHPMGTMHGMHGMAEPHDMGGPQHMGGHDMGMGGGPDMGGPDMGMGGHEMGGMPGADEELGGAMMQDMRHGAGMQHAAASPAMGGGMPGDMGGGMAESANEFDWVFGENTDLEIDSLFNLTEDDEDGDEDGCADGEDEEMNEENLNEFMGNMGGGQDFLPSSGGMDQSGGANSYGGDMGGGDMGDDMNGGDMGNDMDDMGGEEDMQTVVAHDDAGHEFKFMFEPGFADELAGGGDGDEGNDFLPHDGGGEEHDEHHGGPGMGSGEHEEHDNPIGEAAGGFHNGKPRTGKQGTPMAIVPKKPAVKKAAVFPSPMGNKK